MALALKSTPDELISIGRFKAALSYDPKKPKPTLRLVIELPPDAELFVDGAVVKWFMREGDHDDGRLSRPRFYISAPKESHPVRRTGEML